jgi:hypothetical protein
MNMTKIIFNYIIMSIFKLWALALRAGADLVKPTIKPIWEIMPPTIKWAKDLIVKEARASEAVIINEVAKGPWLLDKLTNWAKKVGEFAKNNKMNIATIGWTVAYGEYQGSQIDSKVDAAVNAIQAKKMPIPVFAWSIWEEKTSVDNIPRPVFKSYPDESSPADRLSSTVNTLQLNFPSFKPKFWKDGLIVTLEEKDIDEYLRSSPPELIHSVGVSKLEELKGYVWSIHNYQFKLSQANEDYKIEIFNSNGDWKKDGYTAKYGWGRGNRKEKIETWDSTTRKNTEFIKRNVATLDKLSLSGEFRELLNNPTEDNIETLQKQIFPENQWKKEVDGNIGRKTLLALQK